MTAEQFIKDYTNHCSNELAYGGFHEWLTPEQALRAVEIAKDAFIEKALKFMEKIDDVDEYSWYNEEEHAAGITEKCIEDFKRYLKE